jgi:hypothetical protein
MTMRGSFFESLFAGLLLLGSFWLGSLVYQNHWAVPEKPPPISSDAPKVIPAVALTGGARDLYVENPKRPTLLLVLSADCRYCEQNAPQWRQLVAYLGGRESSPAVLALSLSDAKDTAGYLEANDLEVPVLLIDREGLRALGLPGVPGTIVLDPGSDTMRSWIGVLSMSETESILTWAAAN